MNELKPRKTASEEAKYKRRMDDFFSQTIEENNTRIDGKNIPSDIAAEIKFIQSILLDDHKYATGGFDSE